MKRADIMAISAVIATAGMASVAAAGPVINGGSSWEGWTSVGMSDQVGVYGSGSTTAVYQVYTTVFTYNNDSVTGGAVGGGPTGGSTGFGTGAFSGGAFANGHTILGIGVRVVSGGSLSGFVPTVRFDIDADSYRAASTVGGADGRTSFTSWSEYRDFTVQFTSSSNWQGYLLTMQTGSGTSNGGPNSLQIITNGVGTGVSGDWAFRMFGQASSYQMFFDVGSMAALYGVANPFGLNSNFSGINSIGSTVVISMNGLSTNNVVFGATLPSPGVAATIMVAAPVAGRRRRH